MDHISRTELLGLAEPGTGPRASIYLPLGRTYPEAQQDPTRLRDALDEAEQKLQSGGMGAREAKRFLEPARNHAASNTQPQLDSAGLALLVEEGALHSYSLPYPCPATVDVGARFHLAPLMRLLVWPVDFLLLTVSGKAVRLFRCNRKEAVPVDLPASVPTSLENFLQETEIGRAVRFQTGVGTGPGGPAIGLVHGGTSTKDDAHVQFREYIQKVAKDMEALTKKEEIPLVLAAVHEIQAIFRQGYAGQNLVEQGIHGSPDEMGTEEVRMRGVHLLETTHSGAVKSALDRYHRAAETAGARDPGTIVEAAAAGRIDSLIAAFGERLWGTWDEAATRVEIAADPSENPARIDLVNLALIETLRHDGHVCVVPQSDVPGHSAMVAVYRW
ncbi:MAG: hypothetical protein IT428_12285 [Planctomycetaceae bacterium]|nr:hypothetical protein [Planctomycetaceae bacterium]